jgi:DNA-binding MarR family transcriptional regulator
MTAPDPAARTDETARLFVSAMHALMHTAPRSDMEFLARTGLTLPQIITMHALRRHGLRTVSDVAGCSRLSPAATSHMVERLVRQGLLVREEDPDDRRQRRVSLTEQGRQLVDDIEEARLAMVATALGQLQAATRRRLAEALQAVVDDVEARTGPGEEPR